MKKIILFIIMFMVLLNLLEAPPPETKTVKGIVYENDTVTQAQSGTKIFINNTNSGLTTTTQTSGPVGNSGRYSTTITAATGDSIYVRAYNDTVWGYNTGIMGNTKVEIDVVLNITRDSETQVIIIVPENHTMYNLFENINVTANITVLGNDGVDCNATISFSVAGIFELKAGEPYTVDLGNINRGNTVVQVWNLTVVGDGSTNITVISECGSDDINLENLDSYTAYNVSGYDGYPPNITIIFPVNHSRVNNPIFFYYNISDDLPVLNCNLSINDIIQNITLNPEKETILNFSYRLQQKNNLWEINCTDNSTARNIGSTGLYNLTLNSYPSITTILVDDPIDLNAGSNKTVFCNGTITDADNYQDISLVNATLFYTGLNPGDEDNSSSHYTNTSCTLFNGAGDNIDFRCSFELEYYSNNGTWYCNASALDTINASNTTELNTYVNDLLALGVTPSVIDYGGLEILQISPDDIPVNVTNYGNVMLDLNISAYAIYQNDNISMDCTKGNISLSLERFSITQGQNYNLMTSVNNSINAVSVNFDLGKREGGAAESRKSVYWKLQIPLQTGGICNGKVVFSAAKN